MEKIRIGIVGDFKKSKSQVLLNQSLDWLKETYTFDYEWIGTLRVKNGNSEDLLKPFSGLWSAPGSPFESLEGALEAIRYARIKNIPHLGTCGGMQHTVIEFARNVLGFKNVHHEEYNHDGTDLIISKLQCSLAGKTMELTIREGTKTFNCYKVSSSVEDYYCSFGINPNFKPKLNHEDLRISGIDQDNEIRIIEIPKNDFFIATLFVPQSRATKEKPHPLIKAFIEESIKQGQQMILKN